MPERDTPGISASTWATPIRKPLLTWTSSRWRSSGMKWSTRYSSTPKTASVIAICHGSPSFFSMKALAERAGDPGRDRPGEDRPGDPLVLVHDAETAERAERRREGSARCPTRNR
jgi:hypothetical protein